MGEAGVLRSRPRGNDVVVAGGAPAVLLRLPAAGFRDVLSGHPAVAAHFEGYVRGLEATAV